MLQALGLPLPEKLLSHAHWTMSQKKISKSVGNVVDPFESIERYGVDAVRYYLARVGGRFRDDTGENLWKSTRSVHQLTSCRFCFVPDWSSVQLKKYKEEIQSYIGNFLLRVTSDAMTKRIEGAPHRSLAEVFKSVLDTSTRNPNQDMIRMQLALPHKVESCLRDHEVGDALQNIVDLLRQVRDLIHFKWLISPLFLYRPIRQ